MKNALFIILPYPSHYYACFGYARHLAEEGFKITFTGSPQSKAIIENEGFGFYELAYMVDYKIKSFKAAIACLIQSCLNKSFSTSKYREFYCMSLKMRDLISKTSPDLILIDESIIEYNFFIQNKSVVCINTKLSTKRVPGIPPLNSGFQPNGKYLSNIICDILWAVNLAKQRVYETLLRICFLGNDEVSYWKRYLNKSDRNWLNEISLDHCLNRNVKMLQTVVLAPENFEFPWRAKQAGEFYFHTPMYKNEAHLMTPEYGELLDLVLERKKRSNAKVVYAAFGTLSEFWRSQVYHFLLKLCKALENEENIILVISKKQHIDFLPDQSNLYTMEFVPQVHFLQYVDLMISHGGLGSIKECLAARVPQYILPMNSKSDNYGNAARIKFHQLGLRGTLKTETVSQIKNKVLHLLASHQEINFKYLYSNSILNI